MRGNRFCGSTVEDLQRGHDVDAADRDSQKSEPERNQTGCGPELFLLSDLGDPFFISHKVPPLAGT